MESKDMLTIALTKALTDAVPAEMQKEIFAKALYEHLLGPKRENGGESPLQHAFGRALNEAALVMAHKLFEEPEAKAKLAEALREAFAFQLKDGALVRKLADKMANAVRW